MVDAENIAEVILASRDGSCKELAILHCVSGYPAPAEDYNLQTTANMIERFRLVTGLSDHRLDNTTAIASVAVGPVLSKNISTLIGTGGGPDESFPMEPNEIKNLCEVTKTAWRSLGHVNYERKNSEKENLKFRRSLYFIKDLKEVRL